MILVDQNAFLAAIRFDRRGLIPAVTQEQTSGRILMHIFLDREALGLCLSTHWVHYFRLDMRKVWKKGETSGYRQRIHRIRLNCEGDALLLEVEPLGGACEQGYHTCFNREWRGRDWSICEQRVFDPELVYPEFLFFH